jgi:hypothetical protein
LNPKHSAVFLRFSVQEVDDRILDSAEGVGFEPTVGKPTPVFKTGTFGRSVIPPGTTLVGGRGGSFVEPVTSGDVEDDFAQANRLRRHFDGFVIRDELERLFE